MNTASHVRVWVAIIASLIFLTPFWRSNDSMETYVTLELRLTRETFGERMTEWVASQAGHVYKMLPSESLNKSKIEGDGMKRTKTLVPGPGVVLAVAFNDYIVGLVQMSFIMVLRMLIVCIWLVVLAPVFIASVIDGFANRAIKRAEFGAIRPAAYTVTSMVVVPLVMAPILYLVLPFAISPLLFPMWALVMALPLALMVSNMQPIFGRN